MIWSGLSLSFRPPPARPTLALRLISLEPEDSPTAALNPCAGGKLEFFDVFFGCFSCIFCSLSHSVWINASLSESVSCLRSGSSFMPLTLAISLALSTPELSNYRNSFNFYAGSLNIICNHQNCKNVLVVRQANVGLIK